MKKCDLDLQKSNPISKNPLNLKPIQNNYFLTHSTPLFTFMIKDLDLSLFKDQTSNIHPLTDTIVIGTSDHKSLIPPHQNPYTPSTQPPQKSDKTQIQAHLRKFRSFSLFAYFDKTSIFIEISSQTRTWFLN